MVTDFYLFGPMSPNKCFLLVLAISGKIQKQEDLHGGFIAVPYLS
ncbi:hypothetical protein LEMLEM_LOCUS24074 [Lemmus lemmus]